MSLRISLHLLAVLCLISCGCQSTGSVASDAKPAAASATKAPGSYATIAEDYHKAVAAARQQILQEVAQQGHARRILMIQYYLDHPGDSKLNIGKLEPRLSFARFACVGLDAIDKDTDSLAFLERYAAAVKAVTKEPNQTVSELWKNMRTLRNESGPIPFPLKAKGAGTDSTAPGAPDTPRSPEGECQRLVMQAFESPTVPYDEVRKESIAAVLAVFTAFDKLVTTLESAVKDVAKYAEEDARREAFKRVVLENSDNVTKALRGLETDQFLSELLLRRRQAALFRPYETFVEMLRQNTVRSRIQVIEAAYVVDAQLAEFDALRRSVPPTDLVRAIRAAQTNLLKTANAEMQPAEALAYFKALADELKTLSDDAKSVKTDWGALRKALSGQ